MTWMESTRGQQTFVSLITDGYVVCTCFLSERLHEKPGKVTGSQQSTWVLAGPSPCGS